jgi:hypothetical protein
VVSATDPFHRARRTLRTGTALLSERQQSRLAVVIGEEQHLEVEAMWGMHRRIAAAYQRPEGEKGKDLMMMIISGTTGLPLSSS